MSQLTQHAFAKLPRIHHIVLISVGTICVLYIAGYVAAKSVFSPTRTVTTIGIGSATTEASKVRIVFTFTSSNPDRSIAKIEGEQQFNNFITSLNQFSPNEIVKTPETVQPVANRDANNQVRLAGYQYTIGARVTIAGTQQITDAINFLNDSRATIVSIVYLAEDEDAIGQSAREDALKDARMKAEQIAKASNAKVGKVLSVAEQANTNETGSAITSASTDQNGVKTNSFNQVEVQSAVTVQFELK